MIFPALFQLDQSVRQEQTFLNIWALCKVHMAGSRQVLRSKKKKWISSSLLIFQEGKPVKSLFLIDQLIIIDCKPPTIDYPSDCFLICDSIDC